MEGVIIQTERAVRQIPIPVTVVMLFMLALFLSVMAIRTARTWKRTQKDKKKAILLSAYVAMLLACIAISCYFVSSTFTIHNYLVVTIDDEVRFNEFNQRYEVIDQDGKLYTVRELPVEIMEAEDE